MLPPLSHSTFRLAVGLLASLWLFAACVHEAPACYDREYLSCACGDAVGYMRCTEGRYEACACDGKTPGLDGAAGANSSTTSGGAGGQGGAPLLPFMDPCDDDAQCVTGLCHPFNAKGPHCTKPCNGDDDCPAPSTGCNNMGICKAP
jgi:hypothetical protein